MYITDFVCTYKKHGVEDQEDMYRTQYLQAFGLKEWNNAEITETTDNLYNKCKQSQQFQSIFRTLRCSKDSTNMVELFGKNNDEMLFTLLFRYDLFDISHKCFCELSSKDTISEHSYTSLINAITNNS